MFSDEGRIQGSETVILEDVGEFPDLALGTLEEEYSATGLDGGDVGAAVGGRACALHVGWGHNDAGVRRPEYPLTTNCPDQKPLFV